MNSASAEPLSPTLLNWALVLALGLIWGASFMAVEVALTGLSPLWVATGRIALAAAFLGAVAAWRGTGVAGPRTAPGVWLAAATFGLLSNVVPFLLLAFAQRHVTSGFAGITMAMVPLFTLALAHWFVRGEAMTLRKLAGFLLGLAGVVTLIGTDALTGALGPHEGIARLMCLAATLSYAAGAVAMRRAPACDPVVFAALGLAIAAAVILPVALAVEGVPTSLPGLLHHPEPLLALVYLGLMPTAVATLMMIQVIRSAGPTFLTQSNYQVPVWSVILGTVVLAEPLPHSFLLALTMILAGLALSRWRR